ncbi:MAG: ASCH domain-containing protein [Rhizorhabdus sp.]
MRAVSLWQPWASAVAVGNKSIETRHWTTKYRGPIAIHAAKRWARDEREFASVEHALGRLPKRLPLGAYVAVADLVDVKTTEELLLTIGPVEKIYGNYGDGRFGWVLQNVRALKEPVPGIGRQGFWSLSPNELVMVERQLA